MTNLLLSDKIKKIILKQISFFHHKTLKKNLIKINALKNINIFNNELNITLNMPFTWTFFFKEFKKELNIELLKKIKINKINWILQHNIISLKKENKLKKIKNIIAVNSAKGGVGKSTIALNLSLALIKEGAKVGILDADIYGPSIPKMLGTENEKILLYDNKTMIPINKYNLSTNSTGYLLNNSKNEKFVLLRGPLASKTMIQMIKDTMWPELDYLIIDMPPGTGDIHIALAQNIPVTGILLVTTPQEIALSDVIKSIEMFKKFSLPIIGIVENMSFYECKKCKKKEKIFGSGGAKKIFSNYGIPVLGNIPLNTYLCKDLDMGIPTIVKRPQNKHTILYRKIASIVSSNLYWKYQKNYILRHVLNFISN